mgnify:CR=1 FL=1
MAKNDRCRPERKNRVVSFASHRRFKHLAKVAGSDVKAGRPRRDATASRMVEFAHQVEQTLARNAALPSRSADRSLIGDLADLEWRTAVLWQAIHDLVVVPRRSGPTNEFDARLMMLASSVESAGDIIRDLRRPLTRLLRARCGVEGLALAALAGAAGTIQGLKKSRGRTR